MYLWNHFGNEEEREEHYIQKADSVVLVICYKHQYGAYAGGSFGVNGGERPFGFRFFQREY